jgi:hypothetical protein
MRIYLALLLLWLSSNVVCGDSVLPEAVKHREVVGRIEGLTVVCKGKAGRKYVTDDNTDVMLNGREAAVSGLKPGDGFVAFVSADDSEEVWLICDLPSFEAFHRHEVLTGKATFGATGSNLVLERYPTARKPALTTLDLLPEFRVWVGHKLLKRRRDFSGAAKGRKLNLVVDDDWRAIAAFDDESWRDYADWSIKNQRGRLD